MLKVNRFTPQRQLIFQVFKTLPTVNYLSAESLQLLLVERGEGMSLSTVSSQPENHGKS
ncbi:transcriptional repressor [Nostoc sp. DedQUE07]|uniref:transcriptional repressor n=1 Tax=Nostoc sp. DedQUE07 TaxID=3075392 RepID=UPI002AD4BEB9|nr:transcriptional repressor [Nostoc sp. DedQUE07]MDZ8127669.1 transcriptional repressor [Nostoc sp. DedQUE07]